MKVAPLVVIALMCLGFVANALPQRPEPRTFCRIAHVLAYNDEFGLAIVAVGQYLPDTVMTLGGLPAPEYPGGVFCAKSRAVPEP